MRKKAVHFIGIGGTGLSAIARLLLESGYQVSGSDQQMSPLAHELQAAGARVVIGHYPENVAGADFVIRSSAIPDEHIEVQAAKNAGIPVLKRADFLPELLAGKRTIAIAGTHGKTTATAMIAWLLSAMGLDPSFIVGGVVENLAVNARAGKSPFFVIEADEYDRMFLCIEPEVALVTNVEFDHPDCFPTPEDFYRSFVEFAHKITPGHGKLIACAEDKGSSQLLHEMKKERIALSYGFTPIENDFALDYHGESLTKNQMGCYTFTMMKKDHPLTDVCLSIPGRHNALNALGALAVLDSLELPVEQGAEFIKQFRGAGRRFEIQGEVNGVVFIDDYAHHPTEIKVTLAAVKDRFPTRRLIVVWQPHTYSRVLALWDDFANAFSAADLVVVTNVYAARELAPEKFSMAEQVKSVHHDQAYYQDSLQEASNFLVIILKPGDVLLVCSAGDANKISQTVQRALKIKEKAV